MLKVGVHRSQIFQHQFDGIHLLLSVLTAEGHGGLRGRGRCHRQREWASIFDPNLTSMPVPADDMLQSEAQRWFTSFGGHPHIGIGGCCLHQAGCGKPAPAAGFITKSCSP